MKIPNESEQLNPFMKGPSTSLLAKGSELLWWSLQGSMVSGLWSCDPGWQVLVHDSF